MTTDDIRCRLHDYLEREFPNPGIELHDDTDLLEDWFADSLGIVETVMFIEREFGVDVRRADINAANFSTLAALSRFVGERVAG